MQDVKPRLNGIDAIMLTRKLCYRKDDRAMREIFLDRMSRCGDMAIRNYPRRRPAANLDLM